MTAPLSLLTWNVNSIRARLDHVLAYLAEREPDVVCLQETKVEDRLFPRVPFLELGYHVAVHGSKGHAGVATLTKEVPRAVGMGFADGPSDRHCRILSLTVQDLRVYNVYVPNGTELGSEAFAYKLAWLDRLRDQLLRLENPAAPLVLVGDFNIAPEDRDVWDPEAMRDQLHASPEERAALRRLLGFGLEDCFRRLCADPGHFTWFDYRGGGFARAHGLRIDHVYATRPLAVRCRQVTHDPGPRGWDTPSDHLPVLARFDR
jgi:exodeoxyribonuclease-3